MTSTENCCGDEPEGHIKRVWPHRGFISKHLFQEFPKKILNFPVEVGSVAGVLSLGCLHSQGKDSGLTVRVLCWPLRVAATYFLSKTSEQRVVDEGLDSQC